MKIKYFFLALAVSLLTVSCDDLNTAPNGGTVLEKDITEADLDKLTVGLYQELIGCMNTFGSTDHTDYGIPALNMRLESRGMDMVAAVNGYNHFSSSVTYNDHLYNSNGTMFVWYRSYIIIKCCNDMISRIETIRQSKNGVLTQKVENFLAEARTLRAYAYFNLAQIYQFTYYGNEDKPCVPIKTEKMSMEDGNNNPRATVRQVYDFIMEDLNAAIQIFDAKGVRRRDKMSVNGDVAHGLRARVALVMHNYESALEDVEALVAKYQPYSREDVSEPTFISCDDANWIWGLIYTENSRAVTTGIINWPSHLCSLVSNGYTTGGGLFRCINTNLFAQIGPKDARRGWWLDEEKYSENISHHEDYLDVVETKDVPAYATMKFAPANYSATSTYNTQHYPMMRIEEMILIKAECQLHTEGAMTACNTLTEFVKNYRDPDYMFSSADIQEVSDEIWLQRRLELWGEGFAFSDIMRLGKDVDRRNSNFDEDYRWRVQAGDPVLLYRIPKDEIETNNAISDADNNPSGDLPTMTNNAE